MHKLLGHFAFKPGHVNVAHKPGDSSLPSEQSARDILHVDPSQPLEREDLVGSCHLQPSGRNSKVARISESLKVLEGLCRRVQTFPSNSTRFKILQIESDLKVALPRVGTDIWTLPRT